MTPYQPLRIGRGSLLWIIGIVGAAIFGRQILNFARDVFGVAWLQNVIAGVLLACGVCFLILAFRRITLRSFGILTAIFLATTGIAFLAIDAEERIHILQYAILGALLWRDQRVRVSTQPGDSRCGDALKCLAFGSLIGVSDELLQWSLPWRVGDVRDVAFDMLSVGIGIGCAALLLWPHSTATSRVAPPSKVSPNSPKLNRCNSTTSF